MQGSVGVIKHACRRKISRTLLLYYCSHLIVLVSGFSQLLSHQGQSFPSCFPYMETRHLPRCAKTFVWPNAHRNIFCFRFFSSLVCYDLLKPVLYCIRDLCQYQKYIKGSRFEPVRTQFSLLQYATNLEPNLLAELQNQNRLGPNLQFGSEVHGPNRGSGPNFGNPSGVASGEWVVSSRFAL